MTSGSGLPISVNAFIGSESANNPEQKKSKKKIQELKKQNPLCLNYMA